jgi:hypothetical protein
MMRVLAYGKRLSVVLAEVFLCTSLGLGSVASGVVLVTRGVANPGFTPNGRGLNRGTFLPIRPAPPTIGQLPSQANLPVKSDARVPIINPLGNVCVAGAEQAFLPINECVVVNNAAN